MKTKETTEKKQLTGNRQAVNTTRHKLGATKTAKPRKLRSGRLARREADIPRLVKVAAQQARREAFAHNLSVMGVSGDYIVEVAPDGTQTTLKAIEPGVRVKVGQQIRIR